MEYIFTSLVPVFGLILIGYFFKIISFPSHEFWPLADKLTYFVLMPALLIYTLSKAKLDINSVNLVLVSLLAIFLTMIFLIVFNKLSPANNSSFTSIVQGGIRFNTYVFLALSSSIFGNEGLILSAIILTFAIPFINILCVTVFAIYSQNNKLDFIYLVKSIVKNPLIIGCFIGGSLNILNISLPISISNIFKILSEAALPLGLLSIGYALVLKDMKNVKKDLFISSFAKFMILPIFIYTLGNLFNLNETMIAVLVLFSLLPTAPSSFILARQLGGDLPLMTTIITVQTLVSALFIILFLKFF
ncbi:AEC family transporter [Arcobacter cloacae]|uniref:Transporter n=1 Tax=Arcobacter cloacae TaxID=1054034 RepID=A0A6M8N5S0_9BACT|nr:AEC family transporter [Arcobacter cloacae]QKF89433.1 putative permease [Arcobacter cloacae]RXI39486.1 transporter [Arcobacter cloacae]